MLTRRLQILLDEDRYKRVAADASRRGVSVAAVIRSAIDSAFPPDDDRRSAAAHRILSAAAMEVPGVDDLRRELEESRRAR